LLVARHWHLDLPQIGGRIARRIDFAAPRGHESLMKSISPVQNSHPHV
jgi:hypothetical protein